MNRERILDSIHSAKYAKMDEVLEEYRENEKKYHKESDLKALINKVHADYTFNDVLFFHVEKSLFKFINAYVFTQKSFYVYTFEPNIKVEKYDFDNIRYVISEDGDMFDIYYVNGVRRASCHPKYLAMYILNESSQNKENGFHSHFYNGATVYGQYDAFGLNGKGYYYSKKFNYYGDFVMGSLHGKGSIAFANGIRYTGDFDSDTIHGKGIYYYNDTTWYDGQFKKGKRAGHGLLHYEKYGKVFENLGVFINDEVDNYGNQKREGKEVEVYYEKSKIIIAKDPVYIDRGKYLLYAPISLSKAYGNGRIYYEDGTIEEGKFKEDVLQGIGFQIKNGKRTIGEYKDGIFYEYTSYIEEKGYDYVYYGEMENDEYHGNGVILYDNGDKYEGQFEKGFKHGKGTYTWKNGDVYTGEYAYDRKHGKGVLRYEKDKRYEGEFTNDKMTGIGVLSLDDCTFKGNFVNGQLNGQGECIYPDGTSLVGKFINGKLNGQGRYNCYLDGTYNEGVFVDNVLNGEGTQTHNGETYNVIFKDNMPYNSDHTVCIDEFDSVYVGMIKDGDYFGKGKLTIVGYSGIDESSEWYEGEFKNKRFHGQGRFHYENGDECVGTWENGKLVGKATLYTKDGKTIECTYVEGKAEEIAHLIDKNGERVSGTFKNNVFKKHEFKRFDLKDGVFYGFSNITNYNGYGKYADSKLGWFEGYYKNGKLNGKGEYHLNNGLCYKGEFVDGIANGQGELIEKNGNRYVGHFKNAKRSGQGTCYYADGRIIEGEWKNDELISSTMKVIQKGLSSVCDKTDTYSYEGQILNGKFHGKGKVEWLNQESYEGEFKNGLYDGHGRCCYNTGDIFSGEFKNGKPHGKGIYYRYASLEHRKLLYVLDGKFVEGKPDGLVRIEAEEQFCEAIYKDGVIVELYGQEVYLNKKYAYIGDILHILPLGFGIAIYTDGRCYEGWFENGCKHGTGRLFLPNNEYIQAEFYADRIDSDVEYHFPDGRVYAGDMVDGYLEGPGEFRYNDESVYVEFKKGLIYYSDGEVIVKSDGTIYKGPIKDGMYNGYGTLTMNDGTIISAEFVDGVAIDYGSMTKNGDKLYGIFLDGEFYPE